METKFNIGDMVYTTENISIKKGIVESIGIDTEKNVKYRIELTYDRGRNYYDSFYEYQCFGSHEEAKMYVVNTLTSQYQEDMKKILAMKDE